MTRKEVIEEVKNYENYPNGLSKECRDYIIKALEQEPKAGHWKAFIHNAYHGTDEDGEPIWREVTVYHCNQ